MSAQFPQGATASCVVNLPYSAYSCTVGESFNFENEDITSSNYLSATVFPSENPSNAKISNNLMTRFYRIIQVSNTRNNNALSDIANNIPNLTAYGGEVYFMGTNASGADEIICKAYFIYLLRTFQSLCLKRLI